MLVQNLPLACPCRLQSIAGEFSITGVIKNKSTTKRTQSIYL